MSVLKSFKEYLHDNSREYFYRIKTVKPLCDEDIEAIERVLKKYVFTDISKPTKTIIQKHPLDFQDIECAEVWIVDVTTQLPASEYVLKQELKLALKLPERYIVVRSENSPLEVYTQDLNAREEANMLAHEGGYRPSARLSTNPAYDQDERGDLEEPVYGDEYNKKFREELAKVAAGREVKGYDPSDDSLNHNGIDGTDIETDDSDFNDNIEDSPDPVVSDKYTEMLKNLRKTESEYKEPKLSTKSNYDNDEIEVSRKYEDYKDTEKVSTVYIKNEREGIRKK